MRAHHAAAIDVGEEDDGQVGFLGETHVGDVGRAQIGFGAAARALHDHQIGFAREPLETVHHRRHQLAAHEMVDFGGAIAEDTAAQYHLRANVALRFQQHGVHVDRRFREAGAGLKRLRPANFAAWRNPVRPRGQVGIGGDSRIVAHVLRLERAHDETAPRIGAAQAGHHHALADVGAGALNHQAFGAAGAVVRARRVCDAGDQFGGLLRDHLGLGHALTSYRGER